MKKTNPANVEYAMNCYVLLAEVFTASDCHKLAAACWIATIAFHPQYPRLWQSLGNAYEALLQEDMQKLCFTRAKNLSATFEKSLPESFAKSAYNAAAISSTSMSENNEEETDDGFNDLGSSKTRSQKEAEIERRTKLMSKDNAHPPPWLKNDEKLEDYLRHFMLSVCTQKNSNSTADVESVKL